MKIQRGFTLMEILIVLLLVTTTSLVLLKQQWQTSQYFNLILMRNQALLLLDNASEQIMAHRLPIIEDKRFLLTSVQKAQTTEVQVTWANNILQRQLVID